MDSHVYCMKNGKQFMQLSQTKHKMTLLSKTANKIYLRIKMVISMRGISSPSVKPHQYSDLIKKLLSFTQYKF